MEGAVVSEPRETVGARLRGELVDAPLVMPLDAAAVAAHNPPEEQQRPLDRSESGGTDLDVHQDSFGGVDLSMRDPLGGERARRRGRDGGERRRALLACDGEWASRIRRRTYCSSLRSAAMIPAGRPSAGAASVAAVGVHPAVPATRDL